MLPRMPRKAAPGPYGVQPLKRLLREAGMTHEAAASDLGVSTQFVTTVVNGYSRPSLPNAAKLAQLVGRPIEECFNSRMLGLGKPRKNRPKEG